MSFKYGPMKKFLLSAIIILAFADAKAQLKGFSIGPYVEKAMPTGTMENQYLDGWGAGIGGDIKLPGKLGLTGSVGVLRFGGNTTATSEGIVKNKALMATPIRVGLKYRLPLVYLKLESGTSRLNDDKGNGFILSPGVGIRILGLDVQAKHESWFRGETYSFWGLKASYNF
jgi:hypothetical protein